MSDIGPSLPPHLLAKRKRQQDEEAKDAVPTASGAKRSDSLGDGEKRRRVAGPAMPPALLDERPSEPASREVGSESSDEDDFGPPLPPDGGDKEADESSERGTTQADKPPSPTARPQRDEWMMMPPKQDDLAARMDPSKQRARGFNTGKGAKGASSTGDDSSAWFETPEQKQKRLQEEILGLGKPATPAPQNAGKAAKLAGNEAEAKKKREQIEQARGPSLVDQHKKTKGVEQEDDPSKRAFDREKDMASGGRISSTQRSEMLKKAGGFSSRFAGGSYL